VTDINAVIALIREAQKEGWATRREGDAADALEVQRTALDEYRQIVESWKAEEHCWREGTLRLKAELADRKRDLALSNEVEGLLKRKFEVAREVAIKNQCSDLHGMTPEECDELDWLQGITEDVDAEIEAKMKEKKEEEKT
jgi:hypothetical protein